MKRIISVIIAMFAFSSLVLVKAQTFEEQLYQLSLLRQRYYSVQDTENTISIHRKIIALIEEQDSKNGINLYRDNNYLEEQKNLFALLYLSQKYSDSIIQLRVILGILEKRGEDKSETYLRYLFHLILAYHTVGQYNNEVLLYDSYENLARFLKTNDTEEYIEYLMLKAEAYTALFRIDDFYKTSEQYRALLEKFYIPNSRPFLVYEAMEANQLVSLGRFDEAQKHLNSCYAIIESDVFSFANEREQILIMSHIYLMEGQIAKYSNPLRAEQHLKMAYEGLAQIGADSFASTNELGLLYLFVFRDARRAIDFFLIAKQELERHGRKDSMQYITNQNNLAACYQVLGLSNDAIVALDEAETVVEQYYGKLHPLYGAILLNKGRFYTELLDFDKGIQYTMEAASCMESIYGKNSEKHTICMYNLAVLYGLIGRTNKSIELAQQLIPILERASVPNAIALYGFLFSQYSYNNNWGDFQGLVDKCSLLIKNDQLQDTDVEARFLARVGACLKGKDKAEAQKYFNKAIQLYENLGMTSSDEYLTALLEQSLISVESQDGLIISKLIESYKDLYFSNVIFLNATEREHLVSSSFYSRIKDLVFTARTSKIHDSLLYNYLLFSKGLLLETSINYAQSIYNSNNNTLIGQFSRLAELKRVLNGEIKEKEGVLLENLQKEASSLERKITSYLKETGGYAGGLNITFADVSKALKNTEAAIEFVSYHDYLEDTDYYAALVVKKEWTSPEFIRICKKSDLEKYLSISPAILYGESIASKEAYSLIWGQITPLLSDIKTIFYSPAGCLNRLAIDQLYDGEKRFNDYYKASRLTSTRQVCLPTHHVKYNAAILYGGLYYDEDDATMLAESQKVRGEKSSPTIVFRGFDDAVTRKGWEYLPGTLEEVNQISSIITKRRITCDVYTSWRGNEESFKALSGGNFNIIHLATHGFYMTESQAEKNRFYTSNIFNNTFISNEVSPLKRSGLLLAGGNKAWKGEPVPDGVEDGVLTAEEIASIDLRNCDVVVLSACETGLGEITDEGVYGLQRAFKNAGVNTIIMSLWEVDDDATSFMMQSFYRNLLKGMDKRDSFEGAQKEAKKKYADPRYWASFIMLDD